MNKTICKGKCAQDCWDCGRYFSGWSNHYDDYYDCHVIEITCCIGGYRIFKDEDNDKCRLW